MPIDIDHFEDGPRAAPTSVRILRFLAANDEHAFTRSEMADAIDADPETVGTNLTRLKHRGLVRHREPYWAFTDDHDQARATLQRLYDDSVTTTLFDDTTGGESAVSTPHREAASAFVDRVDHALEAIEALYLFGSVATGSAATDSDVDILAVISNDASYAAVDDRLLDIAYDVQLEHDVRVEVHSLPADEFAARKQRGDPFIETVLAEGERCV